MLLQKIFLLWKKPQMRLHHGAFFYRIFNDMCKGVKFNGQGTC